MIKKIFKNQWMMGFTAIFLVGSLWGSELTNANNPTFFISQNSNCGSVTNQIQGLQGSHKTLYVCIDGHNEGEGFLGAEAQINYNKNSLEISEVTCTNFNSCANLSEPGKIKLLGAAAPLPDGNTINSKEKLGSFSVEFLSEGQATLAYTLTKIINEENAVEVRTGISASVNILPAPVLLEEKPVEPEIIKEPVKEPVVEPEPQSVPVEEKIVPEEVKPLPGLKNIVLSPVTTSGKPGQTIQIIGTAMYHDERPNENITSCFICPTKGAPDVSGKTTYKIISGPAKMSWSKVIISPSAKNGQLIQFNATFTDYKTNTTAISKVHTIYVTAPPEMKKEIIPTPVTTLPQMEAKKTLEEPWIWHASAPESESLSSAEKALEKESQKNSSLPIPTQPKDNECIEKYVSGRDSDQDGLSNRTECYLKINPILEDTDLDTCFDGDEINLFYTNPQTKDDCLLSQIVTETVLITDPKPDWIVNKLNIAGMAPKDTTTVELTAFPFTHRSLKPILKELESLIVMLQNNGEEIMKDKNVILAKIDTLKKKINDFLELFKGRKEDHRAEIKVMSELENYLEQTPENMIENLPKAKELTGQIYQIKTAGIFLGNVETFKEMGVGKEIALSFHLNSQVILPDGTYDLVAVAKNVQDILFSSPVRVSLDVRSDVSEPKPERLDKVQLNFNQSKTDELLSDITVRIKNGRPILSGKSPYGTQVYATWESLALASSIIADSTEGIFEVQAPRELERNMNHRITLYALKEEASGKIRSETVGLNFRVEKNYPTWAIALGIMLILVLAAGLDARYRMKKIDALPPEYIAKENELYEAFGEKHHEKKPEHHEEKQKEVEDAFKN